MPDMLKSYVKAVTTNLVENGIFHVVAIIAVLSLKYYYSNADAETLRWILNPVARMVTMFSGFKFEWDLHAGFVNYSHSVAMAPACAGVNFLIICFAAIFFSFVSRMKGGSAKSLWFSVCAAIAYLSRLSCQYHKDNNFNFPL